MATNEKAGKEDPIQCDNCLKEVPGSAAHVAEAEDYIINFCGLDCYEQWIKKAENEKTPKD